jgi:hypothetical protein
LARFALSAWGGNNGGTATQQESAVSFILVLWMITSGPGGFKQVTMTSATPALTKEACEVAGTAWEKTFGDPRTGNYACLPTK